VRRAPRRGSCRNTRQRQVEALAIDERGRLLAIEVEHGRETTSGTWTPAQAGFYATLCAAWVERRGDEAVESLRAVLDQRVRLGLAPALPVPSRPQVVPVIALGRDGQRPNLLKRLREAHGLLCADGTGWPTTELWLVGLDGSIEALPLGE
jgi:hypothetical protein